MRPALIAALTAALILPWAAPAPAATLGRMDAQIGGRRIAYTITDAADAGSGWEARKEGETVSILWKGPKPTDLMLMEMVVSDGKVISARVLLPEARQGALEANLPGMLNVRLERGTVEGNWLRLKGRLSGTFHPLRRSGQLLPEDGVKLSARFQTWVPGISPPAPPKPKAAAKKKDKHSSTAPTVSKRPHPRSTRAGG